MASKLRAGDRVRILGLTGKKELNGRSGKVIRFVEDAGRWKVVLDGDAPGSSVALKPENLEALPMHGEGLARTLLAARARSVSPPRLKTVHVLGASSWELGLQYRALLEIAQRRVGDRVALCGLSAKRELNGSHGTLERFLEEKGRWRVNLDDHPSDEGFQVRPENLSPIPAFRDVGIQGAWLQGGDRHVLQGTKVYGPDGDNIEDAQIISQTSFSLTVEGETHVATLAADGTELRWSDGDIWVRPEPADTALVHVVLVGPELPGSYPEGQLRSADLCDLWGEPGIHISLFRGTYEAFAASSAFKPAEALVLANPGFAPMGKSQSYFQWAPALRALAAGAGTCPPPLCISTGTEPYGEGEWLGDAIYDVQILQALGFEIVHMPERSPHACRVASHPVCGWYMWAFTFLFRWPQDKVAAPLDDWIWGGCYRARLVQSELPRYRFRPVAPELKPAALDEDEPQGEEAQLEHRQAAHLGFLDWVGFSVRKAWLCGAGASPSAASAAEAIAAAEEFGESARSRPLEAGLEQRSVASICAVATRAAARAGDCSVVVGAAVAAALAVYEALAQAALWRSEGLEPEMVGYVFLTCVDREIELGDGIASVVGERCAEVYTLLRGANRPPPGRLGEELVKLVESVCATAGADEGTQKEVAQAVVDNLDLAIPAAGGREASLRVSKKMYDAPQYYREYRAPPRA